MIFACASSAQMRSIASTPCISGMFRSISTTSGRSCRYSSTAARPVPAWPSRRKPGSEAISEARPARISGWSSAIKRVIGGSAGGVVMSMVVLITLAG
ncbi:hypothetical protein D3C72_1821010 [compost metagenome]